MTLRSRGFETDKLDLPVEDIDQGVPGRHLATQAGSFRQVRWQGQYLQSQLKTHLSSRESAEV
jgi:hypothetical protein